MKIVAQYWILSYTHTKFKETNRYNNTEESVIL